MAYTALSHDLLQRMESQNCAVCDLIKTTTDRKLDLLLREHVTDIDFMTDFLRQEGFCEHHASLMLKKQDPLAHAMMYRQLLDYRLRTPKKRKEASICMMCNDEKEIEASAVYTFASSLDDDRFLEAYKEDGIVCLTHFEAIRKALKQTKSSFSPVFSDITLSKYDALRDVLNSVIKKSDYKYNEALLSSSERRVWKNIVALLIDQNMHRNQK